LIDQRHFDPTGDFIMGATVAVHPTDQTLQSYGLGKLDDALAESVNKHLEDCATCQRRVAEMSSDSFLGRLRDAQGQPGSSGPIVSSLAGLSMLDTGPSAPARPPTNTLPPGLAEHPDYEVVRELGHGGMGTVYLAINRLMGRHEVLKVVSSHLINRRGVLDRFLGEIRNAARLHHTNVVTAYTATRVGESIVFAMEYVEGLDLAKLVKAKGALPVSNACNYVHQAALGLQHANEHGMVHRDIKPSNLMLARQGNRAVIKVLDFGLAKVRSEGAVDGGLTHEGQMLGTPEYVAPEQTIDARKADIRADIYSLGCTLYYLLTGGPPFQATSLYELLQAHHSMDAMPLNLTRPEVPIELAALVGRMMAKEPERRFQEPRAVAEALKPFFKAGNSRAGASKPDVSRADHLEAKGRREGTDAGSIGQAIPATPGSALAPHAPAGTSPPGVIWESLVNTRETNASPEMVKPGISRSDRRRPPWLWPSVTAGVFLLAFIIAWAAGVIRIRTKNGDIVLEKVPAQADVIVHEGKATVKLPGERDPVEITPAPDGHGVKVTRAGTATTGKEVNIGSAEGTPSIARFEPRVAAPPEQDRAKGAPSPEDARQIHPFNGTNFEGWNALWRNQIHDPSKVFRIEGNELVGGEANYGRVFLDRSFSDFSWKFEYILTPDGVCHQASCRLKIAEGEPLQIGQDDFRVGEVGCMLTIGEERTVGEIIAHEYGTSLDGDSRKSVASPTADAVRQPGEWNDVEMRCVDRSIRFLLNGREVNRVDGNCPIRGYPGFQNWGTDIRIRNIRIVPLMKAGSKLADQEPGGSGLQKNAVEQKRSEGFRPLFNGKDLTGWKNLLDNGSDWNVVEGALEGRGGGQGSPALLVSERQDLVNFTLRARFRLREKGLSGVEVRHRSAGEYRRCYWVSCGVWPPIYDWAPPPGNVNKLKDLRYNAGHPPVRVSEQNPVALNTWNTLEITVVRNRIITLVNDQKADDFTDNKGSYPSGEIALFCNGGSAVQFQEIMIEKLPD
jgi:serine/threonine protein kinase